MKVSEAWLKEWVSPIPERKEFFHQLTMAGLEVDGFEKVGGELEGVVVAQIEEVEAIAESDHLSYCKVSCGEKAFQVVCGASNVRPGLKTALAISGTSLTNGLLIKKTEMLGFTSDGMLCSSQELGLGDDHEGIIELPAECPVGASIREALNLDDITIELDLTPNRGDCLSIMGVAREVAVLNELSISYPEIDPILPQIDEVLPMRVDDQEGCPIYVGRTIRDIDSSIKTPFWVKEKLRRSGLRTIGPVVDVTNYVMLELGQPMHAFDLDFLGQEIAVRNASEGETLVLLDEREIDLNAKALIIANQNGPVALAGVMGGLNSGVSSETTDIFLEAAFFNPISVAETSRLYGLHTDASHRFERGVDINLQSLAMERATALLLEIVGGQPGPIVEFISEGFRDNEDTVPLALERINKLLGIEIEATQVDLILDRLGFIVVEREGNLQSVSWVVKSPTHRFDINIEADLIEEVCRIYGYENIPSTLPSSNLSLQTVKLGAISEIELKKQAVSLGLQEVITYSFVDPKVMELLDPEHQLLSLANPMSLEQSVMRSNLFPGLVAAVLANKSRQQDVVRLFEFGSVFVLGESGLVQSNVLSGALWGKANSESWAKSSADSDLYDVKGCVDRFVGLVGKREVDYRRTSSPILHPGQGADVYVRDELIGYFGKLHPSISSDLGLDDLFIFELKTDFVLSREKRFYSPISKFPSVRRDIAIVVDDSIEVAEIEGSVRSVLGAVLVSLTVFDLYKGKGITESRKSVGLGLTLQSQKETLKEEEINRFAAKVLQTLERQFNATLR